MIFFERYRGEGFKNLDFVTKRWNYVQKEKEKDRFISKAVEVTNTREQVARVVDKVIEPALSGMHALVTEKPRLFDVPYNENACSMYGGCVNRSRCFGEKAMAFKIAPTKGAEKEKGSNIMGVVGGEVIAWRVTGRRVNVEEDDARVASRLSEGVR